MIASIETASAGEGLSKLAIFMFVLALVTFIGAGSIRFLSSKSWGRWIVDLGLLPCILIVCLVVLQILSGGLPSVTAADWLWVVAAFFYFWSYAVARESKAK